MNKHIEKLNILLEQVEDSLNEILRIKNDLLNLEQRVIESKDEIILKKYNEVKKLNEDSVIDTKNAIEKIKLEILMNNKEIQ